MKKISINKRVPLTQKIKVQPIKTCYLTISTKLVKLILVTNQEEDKQMMLEVQEIEQDLRLQIC